MFGRKGLKPGENAATPRPSHAPSRAVNGGGPPDPLCAAASYIGYVSPGEGCVAVGELSGLTPCKGPGGALGLCFLFSGRDGGPGGKAYFFPDFASIWADGEAGPRGQIPTEMIANRVPGYL